MLPADTMKTNRSSLLLGLALSAPLLAHAAESRVLWQIGKPDGANAEFALAPGGYAKFGSDAGFVIGFSDPAQDWPYVQPGPSDGWAGNREHTFAIAFGLQRAVPDGDARLMLDLLDTHSSGPPRVVVQVNGRRFERQLPRGAGDASVFGEPAKGRAQKVNFRFPAAALRAGDNEISITTASGSWLLYDAVTLEAPPSAELKPVASATRIVTVSAPPVWLKTEHGPAQPIRVNLRHNGEEMDAELRVGTLLAQPVRLKRGAQAIEVSVPVSKLAADPFIERGARRQQPGAARREVELRLVAGGKTLASRPFVIEPPAVRELWLLPHSHVDIGYTHQQSEVVGVQIQNLQTGMRLARESAANPPGMRFKWNPEAVWTLDHFLSRAQPEQRAEFIAAVRRGDVGIDALYGNMLTGLCRPEELAQCLAFGARLGAETGVPVESAAICDVPGYTWGMVSMMAQAGVKYFAIGPNFSDRVGTIHQWDNQPFYWKSPSGRERLLCWVVDSYHHLDNLESHVLGHLDKLGQSGFPYDTSFLFWVGKWPNGGVDNAPPDERTVEKAAAWNAKYAAPRVVIGLAGEFFREFEKRHGAQLPQHGGDLTPYWEDGAGSTSRETALNRASADRLVQAEALWALLAPEQRPAARFAAAWQNVLLYSEHTWGAWCSISKPDDAFTLDQWKTKQAFALDADTQSRALLADALAARKLAPGPVEVVEVFNTTQWPRTDLVTLSGELASAGGKIADSAGQPVSAQRLASGELAFVARDVPAFGSRQFRLLPGAAEPTGAAAASGNTLRNAELTVEINPTTGAIKSLRRTGVDAEFVDAQAAVGLNDFRYVLGTDAAGAKGNGPVKISVLDAGPLVATLRITSEAPGCRSLVRDVRVVDGLDRVELSNHVDREPVRVKDGVHFGFGFNVPDGKIHMETPWAVVRPNADQLPGSCHNWFTVQRWVDVSNAKQGITWAPLDAPLMEIGGLTANLLGAVEYRLWMTNTPDSQTIYSWSQNNHCHTNYKIDQPGVTTFRFILRPHDGGYSGAEAARFGMETSRPLVAARAANRSAGLPARLTVSSPGVVVETLKRSEDGRAMIVRLFGVSGKNERVKLTWSAPEPKQIFRSNLAETPLQRLGGSLTVPAFEAVTLRAEF